MLLTDALEVHPEWFHHRLREHGDAILPALALSNGDLSAAEVQVFHAQLQGFQDAELTRMGGVVKQQKAANPMYVGLFRGTAVMPGSQDLYDAVVQPGRRLAREQPHRRPDRINAGAHYVDEPVVVDGNLITSRVPDDLPAFCREILRKLGG